MTALDHLKNRARLLLLLQSLPLLPGLIAFAIAITATSNRNPVVAWCIAYWWILMCFGIGLAFISALLAHHFLLRCPFCNFSFGRAAINAFAFARQESAIRHCPHCGKPLSDRVRST